MGTLSAILTVLGILCLGGIPLFFLTFLALMGLTPFMWHRSSPSSASPCCWPSACT